MSESKAIDYAGCFIEKNILNDGEYTLSDLEENLCKLGFTQEQAKQIAFKSMQNLLESYKEIVEKVLKQLKSMRGK
jgi:endonuclease III